jgi:hypothetical protein
MSKELIINNAVINFKEIKSDEVIPESGITEEKIKEVKEKRRLKNVDYKVNHSKEYKKNHKIQCLIYEIRKFWPDFGRGGVRGIYTVKELEFILHNRLVIEPSCIKEKIKELVNLLGKDGHCWECRDEKLDKNGNVKKSSIRLVIKLDL